MKTIEIYGSRHQNTSKAAEMLARFAGVSVVFRDVSSSALALTELRHRVGPNATLPVIFVGETQVGDLADLATAMTDGSLQQMIAGE